MPLNRFPNSVRRSRPKPPLPITAVALACWLSAVAVILGCATSGSLTIAYRLPASTSALAGMSVALQVEDMTDPAGHLTEGAARALAGFKDRYVLELIRDGEKPRVEGGLSLAELVAAAMKHRLAQAGATVVPTAEDGHLVLRIERFTIDRTDRRWKVALSYTLSWQENGRAVRKQTVNAEAERFSLKVRTIEQVMAELVASAVGRANLTYLVSGAPPASQGQSSRP